jgi:hypothetical protein
MKATENNKLIAEFMGYKPTKCNNGFAWDFGKAIPSNQHKFPIQGRLIDQYCDYLKFHSDWNWLMEVVNKVLTVGDDTDKWDSVLNELQTVNIDNVYTACVEFIKWYNESN